MNGTFGDLFAASYTGLLHFDGAAWTPVASGSPFGIGPLERTGNTWTFVDNSGGVHQIFRTNTW